MIATESVRQTPGANNHAAEKEDAPGEPLPVSRENLLVYQTKSHERARRQDQTTHRR